MDGVLELETTLVPRGQAAAVLLTDEQVAALGGGRTPPVRVTVNGIGFRGRVGRMGGENLVGFSKQVRADLGVEPGQAIRVTIALDGDPRDVQVPADLAAALDADPAARAAFDKLAFSHRKEYVRWVAEAKRDETRARRIRETVARLLG